MSWASDMEAIHSDAAGVMHLDVVIPGDLGTLLAHSMMGVDHAGKLITAVGSALDAIAAAPAERPQLCACCPRPISPGGEFWICIASPSNEASERCLFLAVCSECAGTRDEARAKAMVALKRIWPDARTVELHHGAGRA